MKLGYWRQVFFTKAGHFVIINGGEITGCDDYRKKYKTAENAN